MAEISSIIYIIVGFAVGVLSILINITRNTKSFTLFIVVGFILFLWGLFQYFKQKKSSDIQDRHLRGKHKVHSQHNNVHHKINHSLPDKFCPKCGNKMKSFDNFCSNCGFRVR
jgi:sulfite exporter TauE/SafE